MKNHFASLLFAFVFLLSIASAQQNNFQSKFNWLAGTWKFQDKESVIVEEWSGQNMSLMNCKSYEVKGKDSAMVETATISIIGGQYFFTYYPAVKTFGDKKEPVHFLLVSDHDNTFVFENKDHDFPQRVVYQHVNEKECHAWIEGKENGKENKIDFYYTRVK